MRRLVLGVIGHVDHGKTALVRALTGTETDRLPEEKRRGISIALGFAHLTIDGTVVDFIDMPGHERFVRTMVSGATGIDAVLLVASANEGVSPQTIEHVDIAGLLGLRRAIVAVTKADLVSANDAVAVGRAAVALARRAGLEAGVPVLVSATTGKGLPALRNAIAALPAIPRGDDGFAYLPIDRAFSMPGHGTVVTGTLRRGVLTEGSEIELAPAGTPLRIRRLQVHGGRVAQAEPGQRVAVNLRTTDTTEIPRGAALLSAGLLSPVTWLSVQMTAVPEGDSLRTTQRLQLLHGTDEVAVRLRLLDRDELQPGETAFAQLQTSEPVVIPAREKFVLRSASPPTTVAGGRILEAGGQRLRRHARSVTERLATLANADSAGIVAAEVRRAGTRGIELAALARTAGLGPVQVQLFVEKDPALLARKQIAVSRAAFEQLLRDVAAVLDSRRDSHRQGLSREQLGAILGDASPRLLDEALQQLVGTGALRQAAGMFRTADAGQDAQLAAAEADALQSLGTTVRRAGLSPPDVLTDAKARRLVDVLVRAGMLVRTFDQVQKREIVFHRDAIEDARRRLAPALAKADGGLLVGEIGAVLGISRKYSVPLMEYFDIVRFTRRSADRRVLHEGNDMLADGA